MEEKRELVFSLEIDTDAGLKKAAGFRVEIDKDREAVAALNKAIKAQGAATKEQLLEREKLEQRIRKNTQARRDELKSVDSYLKATEKATDAEGRSNQSRKQLQSTLSFLTEKWSGLTKAERENTETGRALSREIKRVTEELKGMESGVGNTYRNVGNYKDAILDAAKGSGKFGDSINTMNDALKVNPVGLLVTALTLLPKLFESSGDSAGLFTGIMEQGTAVLNVFLDRAKFIGEAVSKLLKGDFSGAAAAARKSYQGIGDELQREVKLTGDLAKARYQLERDEARNIATSKRMLNEIERLKNVRDNEFNSIQDRNEANEKAFVLEMKRQKTLEELARRRVEIIQKEVDMRGGAAKASTAMLRELGEAEEALYDILEDSAGKQNELITNRYSLNKELKDKEAAAAKEWADKMEERKMKTLDFIDSLSKADKETREKWAEEFKNNNGAAADEATKRWEKYYKEIDQQRKDDIQKEAEALINKATLTGDFIGQISGLAASALAEQEFNAQRFAQNFLMIILDMLEKTVTAQVAASIASSAAQAVQQPDSVATFGATAAARTVVLTALIKGGFAVFKGILTNMMSSPPPKPATKYAEGGILEGPSHAQGGIKGTGSFAGIETEGGEAIINKRSTSMFAPILSVLNQLGGGKPLMPTTFAAAGGYLPMPTVARDYLKNSSGLMDYDQLAKAIARENAKFKIVVNPSHVVNSHQEREGRIKRAGLGYKN